MCIRDSHMQNAVNALASNLAAAADEPVEGGDVTCVEIGCPLSLLFHGHGIGALETDSPLSGQVVAKPGTQLLIGPDSVLIEVPDVQAAISISFIMYLIAVDDVNDELRTLDSIPVPEDEVDTLKMETAEEDDSASESNANLLGEATILYAVVPDPSLPIVNQHGGLQVSVGTAKGKKREIDILIPDLELHMKAPNMTDMEVHALKGRIGVTNYASALEYMIAVATQTGWSESDTKLKLQIFVERIIVESSYTASGQRSPWLLFLTDPKQPFMTLRKTFSRDKSFKFDMSQTVLDIEWAPKVLNEVVNTVKGIARFSLGSQKGDTDAKLSTNITGLKLDLGNLFPTFSLLNRTREIFNPFGQAPKFKPLRLLFYIMYSLWILISFDMVLPVLGLFLSFQVVSSMDHALPSAGAGPASSDQNIFLQFAPIFILNLLMPGFMHAMLGYYDKKYSTCAGTVFFLIFLLWRAQTKNSDWADGSQSVIDNALITICLLYTSPSPRDS
eukprot:TRINITY_DN27821_c0_g1_i2.p1 TRINITY_DN27821_c0_g1~~TRINITY_DN27821_c0_g1_i2.p1  ORF type:complete len:518 (-),score=130.07 TRINITY_DN27821_c0_g1_i2:112-1617(-)